MDLNHPLTRLTGSDKAGPARKRVQAGSLTCVYDTGMIRYISFSNTELVRCIYSAVRDRNWGTIIPVISHEEYIIGEDHFRISYHAIYRDPAIHFEADYSIEGTSDSRIRFTLKGRAYNTFLKNRIGFCVLHPLEGVLGIPCMVTGPDGQQASAFFPRSVSPHAPMKNISALAWENEAAKCRLTFRGDIWEMEDQRNWTDSSFKTFCTPLSLPFPATMNEGDEVQQTVLLEAQPKTDAGLTSTPTATIVPGKTTVHIPLIGTGLSETGGKYSSAEVAVLGSAGLNHLRHDLKFSGPDWENKLKDAVSNAVSLGTKLELVLHFTDRIEDDRSRMEFFIRDHRIPLCRVWAINDKTRLTDNRIIRLTSGWLKKIFPGVPAGGGTDANFAEFNRNLFDAGDMDFVTFAICPQVHAFDNDSMVENLQAQCDVLQSARVLYPGKGLQVSPVTLKRRFNTVATGEETFLPDDKLPKAVDPRQMSLFAAGWTFGSLLSLAAGGAEWVTFYQATGWQGIIQGDSDPEKPGLFAGRKGDIFPVFHVLRLLSRPGNMLAIPCHVSKPLACSAMILKGKEKDLLVVANHTPDKLQISVEGYNPVRYACWDSTNLPQSYVDPSFMEKLEFTETGGSVFSLEPYSFLFLIVISKT